MDMLTKRDAEITELKAKLADTETVNAEPNSCTTCIYKDRPTSENPCSHCFGRDKHTSVIDKELTKLKAEFTELKTKFMAADTMNHELHKVNTELQEKLTAETKRANMTKQLLNRCETCKYNSNGKNEICWSCEWEDGYPNWEANNGK
jgi:hypothetical protein